jgi:hypothetical protein
MGKETFYTVGKLKIIDKYLNNFNAAGVVEIVDSTALFPNRNANVLIFLDLEKKLESKVNLVLNRDSEIINRMEADLKGKKDGDKVTFEPTEAGFQVKIGSFPLPMPTNEKLELDFDKSNLKNLSDTVEITAEHFEQLFPKKKVNEGHMVHVQMDNDQICGFRSYSGAKMIGEVSLDNSSAGDSSHDSGTDEESSIVELESSEFMKLYKNDDSLSVSIKKVDDHLILVSDYARKDVCNFVTFEKVMKPGEANFWAKSFVKSDSNTVELEDHDGQKVLYSNVRTRIHENYAGHQSNKRVRLKDLVLVSKQKDLVPKIRLVYDSDFRKYIQGEYNQDRSTAFADAKIVEVLIEEGREELLDSDETDLVYKLRRMVHRQDKQRTTLLNNISKYNRRTLDLWMAANPASTKPVTEVVKRKREVEQTKGDLFTQLQKLKKDDSKLDVLASLNDSLLEIKKKLEKLVNEQEAAAEAEKAAKQEKKADSN